MGKGTFMKSVENVIIQGNDDFLKPTNKTMKNQEKINLEIKSIKLDILKMCYFSWYGHIWSSFSIVDLIFLIYSSLNHSDFDLILSKWHAAPALYWVLKSFWYIQESQLHSFCSNWSDLFLHTSKNVNWVFLSTWSLWMGISVWIGYTIINNQQNLNKKTFIIVWDWELNEWSNWESLMFIGSKNIQNIVIIVDFNKIQASDYCDNIIKTKPLIQAITDLWFHTIWVKWHEPPEFSKALDQIISHSCPTLIVYDSTKWYGVSFMENNPEWHHKKLNESEFYSAMQELYDKE